MKKIIHELKAWEIEEKHFNSFEITFINFKA